MRGQAPCLAWAASQADCDGHRNHGDEGGLACAMTWLSAVRWGKVPRKRQEKLSLVVRLIEEDIRSRYNETNTA